MSRSNPSTSGACNWRDDFVPEEIWLDEEGDNTMPFPDKAESKDSEIGLYDELFESDIKRSGEKTKVASDYDDLQKQISHLKSLVAEKDSKLTTMTQHYTNVKKNICSLYKTAKIEIDHKDALLAEANSRLDELLFQRNMTVDQLQTQNTSASHNKTLKSYDEVPAKGENQEELGVSCKSLSKSDNRTADQPSAKRKRSSSPATSTSSDNKSVKPENTFQNKKHNLESKNASKNPSSDIHDNLIKKQNVSDSNSSKKNQTGDQSNQDIVPSNVNSVEENCGLNSELLSESNQEPSIAEVFARMQELAFKDPEATNAVFFNLLPAELRESFLEFEKTQVNALNKLKQSFVGCYFSQCSAGTSEDCSENEPQSSTSFFFQDMSSEPKSESCSSSSAAVHSSDSKSKSQENTEAKEDSDLRKSGKRFTSTKNPINSSRPKNESCSSSSAAVDSSELKSKSQENIEVKKDRDFQTPGKISTTAISFDSKCKSQENHRKVKNSSDFQKSRKRSTSTISLNSSDSKSNPQQNISNETEARNDDDLQKSTKKSKKRHISPRKAVKLYKYNDEKLTLYTQRQLSRR